MNRRTFIKHGTFGALGSAVLPFSTLIPTNIKKNDVKDFLCPSDRKTFEEIKEHIKDRRNWLFETPYKVKYNFCNILHSFVMYGRIRGYEVIITDYLYGLSQDVNISGRIHIQLNKHTEYVTLDFTTDFV